MNRLKEFIKQCNPHIEAAAPEFRLITHFITYADNAAVGYFAKQVGWNLTARHEIQLLLLGVHQARQSAQVHLVRVSWMIISWRVTEFSSFRMIKSYEGAHMMSVELALDVNYLRVADMLSETRQKIWQDAL